MRSLLITGARIATAEALVQDGWLLTTGSTVAGFGAGEPDAGDLAGHDGDVESIDARGALVLPGFIDVHVHGALGHETMDGDVGGLGEMAGFYARHGVTAFLATTWTGSTDDTLHALHGVARGLQAPGTGARLLGAHMEGPYLSARRCGAQDAGLIRPADPEEAARFLDTGVVRLITVAPEIDGNLGLVDECVRRGITVSAGHTDATHEQVLEAISHGVRHLTHTFNAMRPLHHREPGPVGAALTHPGLTAELIADGVHVHPVVMRALAMGRGLDGLVLVTDAMRATGLPPGDYRIGDRSVSVSDGAVRLPDGALAGSVLTFDVAVRNLRDSVQLPLEVLWPAASRNAARVAGVASSKGEISIGRDADLVLIDDDASVLLTVVEGAVVHRRPATPTDVNVTVPQGTDKRSEHP